ncbi:MAG: type II secretion system inner membrane protein GspF [Rhizobium sp.]|nr:type II secretion system inner membrane protein GspF [Rhizobium sp.]
MPAFHYRAVDSEGQEVDGVIDGDTPRHARGELRSRGLLPLDVAPVGDGAASRGGRKRLAHRQLVMLTRQWASLLAAGLTLGETLHSLVDQHEDPLVKSIVGGVRAEVAAGCPLHRALGSFPQAFPPIYVALVKAGEASGELSRVLSALAAYLERQADVRRRTLAALLYPAVVGMVGLLIVLALLVYVVPQVTAVFAHSRQELPILTRLLSTVGRLALPAFVVLIPLSLGGVWLGRRLLLDPERRQRFHRFLLRLPLIGRLLRDAETARFSATLGILIGGGVPLLMALETGRSVMRLLPMQMAVTGAMTAVAEGGAFARALANEKMFPSLLVHLVAGGEKSGRLPEMLSHAAELMQTEVDERLATLTALLEPLLIVLMGGIVLLVVLAIMQPILEVNQVLR